MKQQKKLKVFCRISSNADCGVGWYRQVMPLFEAERQGLIELRVKHFTYGKAQNPEYGQEIPITEQEMMDDLAWCDIAYFSRNDIPTYIAYIAMAQDYFKKPTLVDYDDLVLHTRPVNPGYRSFHPNSEYNKWNHETLKYCTGLTASTEFLKDWYKKVASGMNLKFLEKNIYVLPNSMDMEERDKVNETDYKDEMIPKKSGEFRIIWSGSASHWENLQVALPAVKKIMAKYPNVTFYLTGLFGGLFDDVGDDIKSRVSTVKFVDLQDYGKMLKCMNGDIALAPLTDCNFNRAKSNLRLLEYGSVKYPVIASNVEPYKLFKHGKEALIISDEEWFESIESLIKNKKKRIDLGNNLYKRVKKDFDVKKTCHLWIDAFTKQLDIVRKAHSS